MPTPTYDLIATTTLAAASSEVVFGSIPQTYRDLIIVIQGTVASGANVSLRFNGDTGSNYPWVYMFGSGSSTASSSGTGTSILGGGFNSSAISQAIFQVMDYSATDKHKSTLNRTDEPNGAAYAWAGRWANTAAITTVSVRMTDGGNFNSGATFNLYGVKA
jgi:hypothetical protein